MSERLGEGYPWRIYRNRKGYVRWYQRVIEAWWVLTGRWSLFSAFEGGVFRGASREYHRLIRNRAAICELEAWDASQRRMMEASSAPLPSPPLSKAKD